MTHIQHLLSPAQCLLRALQGPRPIGSSAPIVQYKSASRAVLNHRRAASTAAALESNRLTEFTRDEQIDTLTVQVKSEEGGLQDPQSLRSILKSIDRQTHCVVQLSKPGERDAAVVQIKSKMDLLKQLRDKENQVRQNELAKRDKKPKQLELNWAISENDLNLKLKQMETFLEKGKTVEILLAAKKRQRKATEEEGNSVLKRIKEALQELGAKEIKPMQGQILRQTTLIVKK